MHGSKFSSDSGRNATHSNSVDIPKVAPPMGKRKHTRLLIPETTSEESSKNWEHVTAWLYMLPSFGLL